MDWGNVWFEAGALLPSIGVGLLFWFVIRAILRADRSEREAERRAEADYRRTHPDNDLNNSQKSLPSSD